MLSGFCASPLAFLIWRHIKWCFWVSYLLSITTIIMVIAALSFVFRMGPKASDSSKGKASTRVKRLLRELRCASSGYIFSSGGGTLVAELQGLCELHFLCSSLWAKDQLQLVTSHWQVEFWRFLPLHQPVSFYRWLCHILLTTCGGNSTLYFELWFTLCTTEWVFFLDLLF